LVKTPSLEPKKYGYLNYWNNISLPKILNFYQVKTISELLF